MKINIEFIKKWLKSQPPYTLHRGRRKNFKRRRTVVKGLNDLWQADLADMVGYSQYNDGFKYILVVIDCFSNFLRATPMKNKKSDTVLSALKSILKNETPKNIQTDKGSEFLSAPLKNYMASVGINKYTAHNQETKAAIAERVIRTLKSKIFRYMTYKNSKRYIDDLRNLVRSYNNTRNRYGFKPTEVTHENETAIRKKLFPARDIEVSFTLNLNDYVRISKQQTAFEKGYNMMWSTEIFKVIGQIPTNPPVYEIEDLHGEKILGRFYKEELQEVIKDDYFKIEKIIRQRKTKKGMEYYVKWLGYPKTMNSWVTDRELKQI